MHDDDKPIGRLLRRREVLALFSASAASFAPRVLAQTNAADPRVEMPDCVAQPGADRRAVLRGQGARAIRHSFRSSDGGRSAAGAPLALHFVLSKVTSSGACACCHTRWCTSGIVMRLAGIRMCPTARPTRAATSSCAAIRSATRTVSSVSRRSTRAGIADAPCTSTSKVRTPGENGRVDEFTSQLYFPDELTDRVHAAQPYASNRGQRLLNARDMIFREGGTQLMLPVVENTGSTRRRIASPCVPPNPETCDSVRADGRRHDNSQRPTSTQFPTTPKFQLPTMLAIGSWELKVGGSWELVIGVV
jgi:hypothetical protein